MMESSALINEEDFFLLRFDSRSINTFLKKFAPRCIDAGYDEESACGVCFQVFEQRQQNGSFESDGFSTMVEGCSWVNTDENNKKYGVYGLKIYLTTSDKSGVVWEKFQQEIETKFGNEDAAWKKFKKIIADIKVYRGLDSKLILSELNKINGMSPELKKEIETHLKQWNELVGKELQPKTEAELQKNCVCLEMKRDTEGKIYFQCQKYNNNQLQKDKSNEWKIYCKQEDKCQNQTHVIYFEKKSHILLFFMYIYELIFGSSKQNNDQDQFKVKAGQNSIKNKKTNKEESDLNPVPLISSDINKEKNKSYD